MWRCALAALALLVAGAAPAYAQHHDIVFMVLDDIGVCEWDNPDWAGGTPINCVAYTTQAAMPSMDAMVDDGVTLYNFFTEPVCVPTRMAALTGLDAHRTGISAGIFNPESVELRLNRFPSVANVLQENGWATGLFGKSHVCGTQANCLLDAGFEVVRGMIVTNPNPPSWSQPDTFGLDWEAPLGFYNWMRGDNRTPGGAVKYTMETSYATDEIFSDLISWLDETATSSRFAWVGIPDAHAPFDQPPGSSCGNDRDCYVAKVAYADTKVGELMASIELRDPGLANTTVCIMPDNGTPSNAVGLLGYSPFRVKASAFAPGTHTWLTCVGKGVTRTPGTYEGELWRATDVKATIEDLAGVGATAVATDSLSFKACLEGACTGRPTVWWSRFIPSMLPPPQPGDTTADEGVVLYEFGGLTVETATYAYKAALDGFDGVGFTAFHDAKTNGLDELHNLDLDFFMYADDGDGIITLPATPASDAEVAYDRIWAKFDEIQANLGQSRAAKTCN